GASVTGNATRGIRRVAYDNSSETYSDLCNSGCEVHDDGEIWASALWDLRTRLIQKLGHDNGKYTHELLIVDGMKNTVTNPTFLNARDGILAADTTDNAGANQCLIWDVFAGRGMGFAATSTDPTQRVVTADSTVPPQCRTTTSLSSSRNPAPYGDTVTLTATVSPTPPATGPAQGT